MTPPDLKTRLKRAVGKLVVRIEGIGAQYREALRHEQLARTCRADPTANIAASARLMNIPGNPDDIVIGRDSAVLGELAVLPQGGCIRIGAKSFVGPGTRIWSAAGVTIGDYVLIAHDVNIIDNNSHPIALAERRAEIDAILPHLRLAAHGFDLQARPIVIEDGVWIGFGASVLGGVRIGKGVIVGAGTMVTSDVAPFTLVVGNPMRVVRELRDAPERVAP